MLVFDDAFVVVLEEQRSFDDNDDIDVQQLQTQPIAHTINISLSLSFVLRLTHGHRSQEGNVAFLPLALRTQESAMLPLIFQTPSLDLSLSLPFVVVPIIHRVSACSLTPKETEKHQHSHTKLKPFNDSREAAICSCEYEQALYNLQHTRPIALSLTLSDT